MATKERNVEGSNKSEWRAETKKVGLMLDDLIETAEDKPCAYILIAVEKESDGTAVGIQVNGMELLLAQGLATFLAKDDSASIVRVAHHLVASHLMDDGEPEEELSDKLLALMLAISGNK